MLLKVPSEQYGCILAVQTSHILDLPWFYLAVHGAPVAFPEIHVLLLARTLLMALTESARHRVTHRLRPELQQCRARPLRFYQSCRHRSCRSSLALLRGCSSGKRAKDSKYYDRVFKLLMWDPNMSRLRQDLVPAVTMMVSGNFDFEFAQSFLCQLNGFYWRSCPSRAECRGAAGNLVDLSWAASPLV